MGLASYLIVLTIGSISLSAVLFIKVLCISLKCVLSYLPGNEAKSNVVLFSHVRYEGISSETIDINPFKI